VGFLGEGASSQPSPHQLREARSPKVFNSYFSSVCVTDNGILPICRYVNLQCILEGMTFENVDVLRSINKMKGNCSSGPHVLPPLLFKKLKYSLCNTELCFITSSCL